MSVAVPIIDSWDGTNRRIYLKQGVSDIYPIEDIYHEYTNARRLNTSYLRKYAPLLRAEGNVKKGGGAFTPRYVVLIDGTKIVPYNELLQINQLGDMITDDPDVDATLYDISSLTVPKVVFIKPSEAEIIQLNSAAIEYGEFGDAGTIDVINGVPGLVYPTGTRRQPSNNIPDAMTIIANRGFDKIQVIGDLTLGVGDNVENKEIIGQSIIHSKLLISDTASTLNCEIHECTVEGVLDGGTVLRLCNLQDLTYINGVIYECIINGTIVLGGNAIAQLFDCYSGQPGVVASVIDCGGSGQALNVKNYNGILKLTNKTGLDKAVIGINAGKIVLDLTCSAGEIMCRGVGKLVDINGNPIYSGTWNGVTIINELTDGTQVQDLWKLGCNKITRSGDVLTIYKEDGITVWKQLSIADGGRVNI